MLESPGMGGVARLQVEGLVGEAPRRTRLMRRIHRGETNTGKRNASRLLLKSLGEGREPLPAV